MIARSLPLSLALAAPFLFASREDTVTELDQLHDVPVLDLAGEPRILGDYLDDSVTVLAAIAIINDLFAFLTAQ